MGKGLSFALMIAMAVTFFVPVAQAAVTRDEVGYVPAYESLWYLYNGMVFRPDSTEFTEGLGIAYDRVDEIPEAAFEFVTDSIANGEFEWSIQHYSKFYGDTTVSKKSLENKFRLGYMGRRATKNSALVEAALSDIEARRGKLSIISFNYFAGLMEDPYVCADYAKDEKSTNMYLFGKQDPHPMVRINLEQIADLLYPNQEELTINEFTTLVSISYITAQELLDQLIEAELKRYFDEGLTVSEAALSRIDSGLSKGLFENEETYTVSDLSNYHYVSYHIPYTPETFRLLMGSAIATVSEEEGKTIRTDKNDGIISVYEFMYGEKYLVEGEPSTSWPLADLLKITAPGVESYNGATINKTIGMMDITVAHFIEPFLINQELIDEAVERYGVEPIDNWDYYDNVG